LGTRSANGRAFAGIELAELDPGRVDGLGHLAAESVDLFNEVALADPPDGRVARHLADVVEVQGNHQRPAAQACGRQGGFDAGVPGADDNDVKALRE
jgi:hypothetical protein